MPKIFYIESHDSYIKQKKLIKSKIKNLLKWNWKLNKKLL